MLFKVAVVALMVIAAASADLTTVTSKMRRTIEWLAIKSELDKNSTLILAFAAGSMQKQLAGGIETQVQAAYLDLIISLSREKLFDTDAEARLYFTARQLKFVGEFSDKKTVTNQPVDKTSTIYQIYKNSQVTQLYTKCLKAFYADNPKVLADPGKCVISTECMMAVLDPSKGIGPDLRYRYILIAEKLHMCNNFSPRYDTLIAGQMQELNNQINTFLKYIADNGGKLDPRLRYTFLRKILLLALSGYNVITPTVEAYVDSLYNSDGYCGVKEDVQMDKVILSTQCYAIWAFKRQLLLNK